MKRIMTGVVAAALMIPSLTACGGGDSFCDAAPSDLDVNDPAALKTAFEDIVDEAPDEVKDDVEVIIEQLGAIEEDPTNLDVDAMTKATDELVKWEEENCSNDDE